jgi:hypothetical protein
LETPCCHAYVSKLQKLLAHPTNSRVSVVPIVVIVHNEKEVFLIKEGFDTMILTLKIYIGVRHSTLNIGQNYNEKF